MIPIIKTSGSNLYLSPFSFMKIKSIQYEEDVFSYFMTMLEILLPNRINNYCNHLNNLKKRKPTNLKEYLCIFLDKVLYENCSNNEYTFEFLNHRMMDLITNTIKNLIDKKQTNNINYKII